MVTEEGEVAPGPEMPRRVCKHSIASFNATTSILTGGNSYLLGEYTQETWYFNHVSKEFQRGPSLITGRSLHASATLQDHDTKEDIVAVVGGENKDFGGDLDSTEFLRNGKWSPG